MNTYELMELCFTNESALKDMIGHEDWRVRYSAAVAVGELCRPEYAELIEKLLEREEQRDIYSQPPVTFIGSKDDTRMSEQIGPIEVVFPIECSEEQQENWKCRGRVKFAAIKSIVKLKTATERTKELLCSYIGSPGEDYNVRAASAHALGIVGDARHIVFLEKSKDEDEWCTQTEVRKAISLIKERS